MCTVTFIPVEKKVFLVSSRDECHTRKDALKPAFYKIPGGKLLYPKDTEAGGTWIALHENGNAVVLLNGGKKAHDADPPYRKSRGLVLLDLVAAPSPSALFLSMDLDNIEPFTVVCLDSGRLWEAVWDGEHRSVSRKDEKKPQIWSSVTLYDQSARAMRENWFEEWLVKKTAPSMNDVLDFHRNTGDGNLHNDLLMNRGGHLYTVSITAMEIGKTKGEMVYLDLRNDCTSDSGIMFTSPQAAI